VVVLGLKSFASFFPIHFILVFIIALIGDARFNILGRLICLVWLTHHCEGTLRVLISVLELLEVSCKIIYRCQVIDEFGVVSFLMRGCSIILLIRSRPCGLSSLNHLYHFVLLVMDLPEHFLPRQIYSGAAFPQHL